MIPVSVPFEIVRNDACQQVVVEAVYSSNYDDIYVEDVCAVDEFGKRVELTEREWDRAVRAIHLKVECG